ncbi:MAG TPA: S24 family peptidase [Candidatus Paceibacterota bacterium]|nr:S24 family peptidase [Candidatus Paceibacterota bacterium]
MHSIQDKLLDLSKRENLAKLSLRDMAKEIGLPGESPQKIKHHLLQLQKKGFLSIDKAKGVMERASSTPGWARGLLDKTSSLFSIPIVGTANCGPATIFAEQNFHGFIRVSSKLIGRAKPTGLYAIKADGSSMNCAEIGGRKIEDGDFMIVDKNQTDPKTGDAVLAIIDNKATVKRFIDDRKNGQIVLRADSSFDYEPIYLHPDDDFSISGKVVGVIKRSS